MRVIAFVALLFALPASAHAQQLSPAEAVAVLRSSHSVIDLTDVQFGDDSGPRVFLVGSSPTAGPFGEFKVLPSQPLSRGPNFFRVSTSCHGCSPEFVGNLRGMSTPDRTKKRARPQQRADK